MLGVFLIQLIKEEEVTQMKNLRRACSKVDFGTIPGGIGPTVMKKSTAPTIPFGHHICVGGACARRNGKHFGSDPMVLAIVDNVLPKCVLPHEPGPFKRKLGTHLGQVEKDIVRRTTGSLRLT